MQITVDRPALPANSLEKDNLCALQHNNIEKYYKLISYICKIKGIKKLLTGALL